MMLCLLCQKKKPNQIKISSKKGQELKCSFIIAKHFWFQPSTFDDPKINVCFICWDKVKDFHQFYLSVAEAYDVLESVNDTLSNFDQEKHDEMIYNESNVQSSLFNPEIMPEIEDSGLAVTGNIENVTQTEIQPANKKSENQTKNLNESLESSGNFDGDKEKEVPMLTRRKAKLNIDATVTTEINQSPLINKVSTRQQKNKNADSKTGSLNVSRDSSGNFAVDTGKKTPKSKLKAESTVATKTKQSPLSNEVSTRHQSNKNADSNTGSLNVSRDSSGNFAIDTGKKTPKSKLKADTTVATKTKQSSLINEVSTRKQTNKKDDPVSDSDSHFHSESDFYTDNDDSDFEKTLPKWHKLQEPTEKVNTKFKGKTYNEIIAEFFKTLECTKCNFSTTKFDELKTHFQNFHKSKNAAVTCCNRTFHTLKSLSNHILFHSHPEHLKCSHPKCDRIFPNIIKLQEHEFFHKEESKKETEIFHCEQCPRTFESQKKFHSHQASHLSNSKYQYICTECGLKHATQHMLLQHVKCTHKLSCISVDEAFDMPESVNDTLSNFDQEKHDEMIYNESSFQSSLFNPEIVLEIEDSEYIPELGVTDNIENVTQTEIQLANKKSGNQTQSSNKSLESSGNYNVDKEKEAPMLTRRKAKLNIDATVTTEINQSSLINKVSTRQQRNKNADSNSGSLNVSRDSSGNFAVETGKKTPILTRRRSKLNADSSVATESKQSPLINEISTRKQTNKKDDSVSDRGAHFHSESDFYTDNDSDFEQNLPKKFKIQEPNENVNTKLKGKTYDEIIAEFFKTLKCTKCNFSSTKFDELKTHFQNVHKSKNAAVTCCNRTFHTLKTLSNHILFHLHPEHLKCSYPKCDRIFSNQTKLKEHEFFHKEESKKETEIFHCEQCPRTFESQKKFQLHQASHLSNAKYQYICAECGLKHATRHMLLQHLKCTHNLSYVCDECGKELTDSEALKIHMLQHSIVYPCSFCEKVKSSLGALNKHIFRCHNDERKLQCTICEKTYKFQRDLNEHINSHTKEILYTCDICSKTFTRKSNLRKHKQRTHSIAVECGICNAWLKSSHYLKIHIKTVHEISIDEIRCHICGKASANSAALKSHIKRMHSRNSNPKMKKHQNSGHENDNTSEQ